MTSGTESALRRRRRARPMLTYAVVFLLLLSSLIQRPGSTTFDTKLDLVVDPAAFLRNALQPWNPAMNLGSLQNQASGYLFPIGPFFVLGDALGVPEWWWQRVWSGLVLVAAFGGMRALARAWLPMGERLAVVAGLAYAVSPRVLTTVGVLSGETLPGAVLPWTVVPLVLAARGRMRWRVAVLLSAATIPFMGGQNATEVLAVLPLPFLVILCAGTRAGVRVAAAAGWSALVVAATVWWMGPLLILGGYAPPFLDFVESAAVTTSGIGWLEALRGVTHWVAYLPVGVSHWQAGYDLVYRPVLVLSTALVSALGLVGLTGRRLPDRGVLLGSLGLGLVLLTLGHGGPAGSPLWEGFRGFLDGAGAPIRNVHKVDPLVRVPLALGLAVALPALGRWGNAVGARWWRPVLDSSVPALRGRGGRVVTLGVVGALLVSALPVATGSLRAADGWASISPSWQRMSGVLGALPPQSRVLVVPAATSVAQVWGRTVDEPIQTVDGVAWASRSQIPLVPVGGLRLLDALEQQIASGQPSDALAPLLRRSGVSHVLVRSDLVPTPGEPSPARVRASIDRSPGLVPVESSGRGPSGLAQLTLYAVTSPAPLASAVPLERVAPMVGATEGLLGLIDARVTLPGERLVAATDPGLSGVVTDSPKRRERAFGRLHDATSEVLTADAEWSASRSRHDFVPVVGARPSTRTHPGVSAVRSSSSASSVEALAPLRPDEQPWAALDGSLATHWASAPLTETLGQWWEVGFTQARVLGPLTIVLDPLGADVTRLRVTTDRAWESAVVGSDGVARLTALGGAPTTRLRITVVGARGGPTDQVRIAEVSGLPALDPPSVLVPEPVRAGAVLHVSTDPGRRSCVPTPVGPECDSLAARPPEEGDGPSRVVTFATSGSWSVSARATATGGPAVDALFDPLGQGLTARASSTYGSDPLVRASAAVDGDPGTAWVAAPGDPDPSFTVSWEDPRPVRHVSLTKGAGVPGGLPEVASVEVDGEPVAFRVRGPFLDLDRAVRGTSVRLGFLASPRPFGVSEVSVSGLEDQVVRVDDAALTGTPCGLGPRLVVGDQTIDTRLSGSLGDVVSGAEIDVIPCGGAVTVPAGETVVRAQPVGGFAVQSLTLMPTTGAAAGTVDPAAPAVEVVGWEPDHREVVVEGGGDTLLTVAENANAGWTAAVQGQELEPRLVDGWAQGWIVPAGTERRVVLTYAPAPFFRWSIFVGLVLAALVVVGAVAVRAGAPLGAVPVLATAGEGPEPVAHRHPRLAATATVLVVAATGVLAGPMIALASVAALALPARYTSAVRQLVVVLVLVAAAWRVLFDGPGGWETGPDLVVAVSVGLVAGLLLRPGIRGWSHRARTR